ncbi:hypothetical protein C4573_05965 [Candidatus Woesearchaeota archaeon]|nr:MAG: hypothetical protein C4573_05965 [Candidatus Woesearchaeota archaeon]
MFQVKAYSKGQDAKAGEVIRLIPTNKQVASDVYVLPERKAIIDLSHPECTAVLPDTLLSLGIHWHDYRLLATHLHFDHIGNPLNMGKPILYTSAGEIEHYRTDTESAVWKDFPLAQEGKVADRFIAQERAGGVQLASLDALPDIKKRSVEGLLNEQSNGLYYAIMKGHSMAHAVFAYVVHGFTYLFYGDAAAYSVNPHISLNEQERITVREQLIAINKRKNGNFQTFAGHTNNPYDSMVSRF